MPKCLEKCVFKTMLTLKDMSFKGYMLLLSVSIPDNNTWPFPFLGSLSFLEAKKGFFFFGSTGV
jgi:hypothetical protein